MIEKSFVIKLSYVATHGDMRNMARGECIVVMNGKFAAMKPVQRLDRETPARKWQLIALAK